MLVLLALRSVCGKQTVAWQNRSHVTRGLGLPQAVFRLTARLDVRYQLLQRVDALAWVNIITILFSHHMWAVRTTPLLMVKRQEFVSC